jgi:type IV secretory pathway ATPase VirB11/archaellum biosynthesis ATPase
MYWKVKLQKNWYEKKKLEALDRMITKVMLEAEDQCRIHHRQPWTKEVNKVMTTANIIRINLSRLKNNLDCTEQIAQKQALLKQKIALSENIKEATLALRIAQKNCRTLFNEQQTQKTTIDEEQEATFVAMNPEIGAKRVAQIFKRAKDTKQMMSELPSKMNCPGGISSILVPLPKEGTELEYFAIMDGPTIERLILNRNI